MDIVPKDFVRPADFNWLNKGLYDYSFFLPNYLLHERGLLRLGRVKNKIAISARIDRKFEVQLVIVSMIKMTENCADWTILG